jgi:hypothetical protein
MLWAHHFALGLPALHLAAVGVETLATCGTRRLVAYWTTFLVAFRRIASPRAHWCTVFRLALLLHALAPFFPTAIAMEVTSIASRGSFHRWWLWQVFLDCFQIPLNRSLNFLRSAVGFSEIASMKCERKEEKKTCAESSAFHLHLLRDE